MKTLSLFVFVMVSVLTVQAQSKSVESLYNKYKKDKDFFHMDLAGNFLNFAEGLNFKLDDANMSAITKSVERVKLFKLPVSGNVAQADFKALQKGLERERYEVMMEVSDKGSGITMYSKGGTKISDIIMLITGEGNADHMVIALEGEFDSQAIAQAGQKAIR
ncbi:MAG TPA: DUF4252 domain-containing protein [Cyclobacteriaceae bacterium]|nr:DUF4252 domain-containing protein [Cyclobacteriaceae bacterium]